MKILFLHGWTSVPGGRKPTYLADHGHEVINPALPDEDFSSALRIAQAEYDEHCPDVVVGSSRGGAVAMNIRTGNTPLVLLCPAWKRWGSATTVKWNTTILHSCQDDVIPFGDSKDLVVSSRLPVSALVEVGADHRLAAPESLACMLEKCDHASETKASVDVTVYYLEMLQAQVQEVPPPRDGLTVIHAKTPSVAYFRYLYNLVGRDYFWLRRGSMPDAQLAKTIQDPLNDIHVLHVDGSPAGFAELDRRQSDQIELVQFGLMGEFIGQGLGKWFLQWTIDKAFSCDPQRFWLHTCTLDHPTALDLYQKFGFTIYKEETVRQVL